MRPEHCGPLSVLLLQSLHTHCAFRSDANYTVAVTDGEVFVQKQNKALQI